jgi:hypothetical protein
MKRSAVFLACSVALTLLFYLLAYFFLPPPPPSAAMMLLFAGIAMALVWVAQMCVQCLRSGKQSTHTVKLLLAGALTALLVGLSACAKASAPPPAAEPAPAPVQSASDGTQAGADSMPRVTGTALLASSQKEEDGYGLYSYALLSHPPADAETPKYRAFFTALLNLPTASELAHYVAKARINITYIPVSSVPSNWEQLAPENRVAFVMAHYDYARGAVMLASLSQKTGAGPVITSLLKPLNAAQHPHPVLIQDMSTAQATLINDYVTAFVHQAAQDRFWQPNALQSFALSLRNVLETAATGLGMSQQAVNSWVQYFK